MTWIGYAGSSSSHYSTSPACETVWHFTSALFYARRQRCEALQTSEATAM